MRRTQRSIKHLAYAASLVFLMNTPARAGGFSLYTESSVSELSVFAAGSAAEAPDASIGWYNPAGLVLIPQDEILFSGIGVLPSTSVSGTSSYNTDGVPSYVQSFEGLQGGRNAMLPTLHLAHPLGERAALGLSILSPFGLSTNWAGDSALRYAGTFTELLTLNVAPEIGGFLFDNLAIGLGLDLQWARVTFNAVAGSPADLQYLQSFGGTLAPTMLDSRSENTGSSFGVGFHAGLLAFFNDEHTRIGLNFQSAVPHRFEGTSTLTGPLADPDPNLENTTAVYRLNTLSSNDIRLPNITTLSVYQDMNEQWAMLASVVFTGWSVFKTTDLESVAGYSVETGLQTPINILTPQHYRNTWRAALGTTYQFNQRWMLRLGSGYDQTPTVNSARDARLPDVDRWAVTFGLHYQPRTSITFDAGYVYLWGNGRSSIHKTQVFNEQSNVRVDGWGVNHAQLVGFQAVWKPIN
jgi:long-chain fatty acid transport protein